MPCILTIKLRDFGRGCVKGLGTRQRNKIQKVYSTKKYIMCTIYYFHPENIFIYTRTYNVYIE